MAHCVHVSNCRPDAKYRENRTQTLLNKVLGLKGTPCDAYPKRLESHCATVLNMRGLAKKEKPEYLEKSSRSRAEKQQIHPSLDIHIQRENGTHTALVESECSHHLSANSVPGTVITIISGFDS